MTTPKTPRTQAPLSPDVAFATGEVEQFVAYGDVFFKLETVHLKGVVWFNGWRHEANTPQGRAIASRLPTLVPECEPVVDESERVRRRSPLSFVRFLADEARREGLHLLAISTYEAAHIQEDIGLPVDPFLEFMIVSLKSVEREPNDAAALRRAREKLPRATLLHNSSGQFHADFAKADGHLRAGDIFEIVLSRGFEFQCDAPAMRSFLA